MCDFPFDLVGFDLDGTLVDSAPDLTAAVNHALGVAGRAPLDLEAVRPMIGGGGRVMLQRALQATGGEDRLDELLPILFDFYESHIAVLTRPFPGVIEALDRLATLGVRLAVVSNKRERFSVALLKEFGLFEPFACVIGGDTLGVAKPDPAPIHEMIRRTGARRAAFVGDTRYDVEAARNAGVPCVLFAPGGGRDALGADATIADYDFLIDALREISK